MTREDTAKLSDEKANVQIHNLVTGKRFVLQDGRSYELFTDQCPQPFSCYWRGGHGWLVATTIPSYCSDLNALHEAEKKLNADQQQEYSRHLQPVGGSDDIICWDLIHASVRLKAEAFLRTMQPTSSDTLR